ncbi:MAG: class II glutamine amidotransferase [Eubacterium sp.]|nr:class II glutamine amidotransferase [Eubacterium sp.]
MCELFGYTGNKRKLNNELGEFFSHSDENPDGWGIASFDDREPYIEKSTGSAKESHRINELLGCDVISGMLLAHIRRATIGYDEYLNAHPFCGNDDSGRMWTLIHNGTIFDADALNPFLYTQKGTTDSERVFLYLIKKINDSMDKKGRDLTPEERFGVIDLTVRELSPHNKLNLMIYDSDRLYVHCNCRDTLYMREDGDGIAFSTKPLEKTGWKRHPFTTLVSYKDGEAAMTGESHDIEYIPDEKSIRALYLAYAGL